MKKACLLGILLLVMVCACENERRSQQPPSENGGEISPEEARAELKEKNIEFSEYAFLFRIRNNDVETVKLFLAAGMSTETVDRKRILSSSTQATAFDYVMSHGRPEMFLAFIEAGADINSTDQRGATPLMHAAMMADPLLVATLVQRGADVNASLGAGWTPLLFAVNASEIDVSEALTGILDSLIALQGELGGSARQQKKGEARKETENVIKCVHILLMAGADVNHKMAHGDTPLMFAALAGRPTIATMLLEAGADPQLTNLSGETALAMARKNQHLEVIKVLESFVKKQ